MIPELEIVALTVDLPEHHLQVGDTGTVVDVVAEGKAYVVEFMSLRGKTIAVVEVQPMQVRVVNEGEIANARLMSMSA